MLTRINSKIQTWKNAKHWSWMCGGVCIILLFFAFVFLKVGYSTGTNNAIFIGIMMLWLNNLVYAFSKLKERILFLFFNLTLALFTLTRPCINLLQGYFDCLTRYSMSNMTIVLRMLWITMIALFVGAVIVSVVGEILRNKRCEETRDNKFLKKIRIDDRELWIKNLRCVAEITFYASYCCFFIRRMEEYLFVRNGSYIDYYTTFSSQMPYVIYVISTFMKYALVIFLATLPSKKRAFIPLALYVIGAVPSLLVGMRNPLAQNLIFVFLYYFIRDVLEDKKKWIGRIEKSLVIVGLPSIIAFFGAYAFIRSDLEFKTRNIFTLMFQLIESQGVTFEVLHTGCSAIPYLPQREFRNYTFGGFIDYFTHGTIAQKFFGATPLPSGNNLTMALESNSFCHNMSYVAMGQKYLDGHGWGSSYLLEVFVDYGYWGVAIFSLILGAFMIYIMKRIGKNMISTSFFLLCLMGLFFVPRASATGWLEFIITAQCWVSVFLIVVGAYILTMIRKKYPNFLRITIRKKEGRK